MERIIVFAFPLFAVMILAEYAWGVRHGRNSYRINDAISSLSQGLLSQVTVVFTQFFHIGIYTLAYAKFALWRDLAFWHAWYGWIAALVLADFCGYWHHRLSHEVGVLWAAHVVHHQSQDFNFTTALRQELAYPILGSIFYVPMFLAGVPPEMFAISGLAVLLYQVWIHTEQVGRLGWFDRVFSSPSNHRVHHAVNDRYIDRNYGNVLMIWDHLFGTFVEEGEEKCVYGTRPMLDSWDPLWANVIVYGKLLRDSWRARRWRDKLRVWFLPPGWRPRDVAERYPAPAFDISAVRRFDPPMARGILWFAALQFLLVVAASAAFLWYADTMRASTAAVYLAALCAALWSIGSLMRSGKGIGPALLADGLALVLAALAA